MAMRKRLIIYDLDGTLVDTGDDIVQSVNSMMQQLGRTPLNRGDIIPCIGGGLRPLVVSCLKTDDPRLVEQGMKLYRAHYTDHLLYRTVLYPSARRLLERFKDRHQAMVTNKPNPFTATILNGLGIAHFFVDVITGDSGYPRKPDPTAIHLLMEKTQVTGQETVFVGDSAIDVETGHHAGVFTVAVTHGFGDPASLSFAQPHLLVPDLNGLIAVANREGW
jgi:phosphoglycolate phosphatase